MQNKSTSSQKAILPSRWPNKKRRRKFSKWAPWSRKSSLERLISTKVSTKPSLSCASRRPSSRISPLRHGQAKTLAKATPCHGAQGVMAVNARNQTLLLTGCPRSSYNSLGAIYKGSGRRVVRKSKSNVNPPVCRSSTRLKTKQNVICSKKNEQ